MGGTPNKSGNDGAENDVAINADIHFLEEGINEAQAQYQRELDEAIFKAGEEDFSHGGNPPSGAAWRGRECLFPV